MTSRVPSPAAAEHIPDGINSNKRPRQGAHKLDGDISRAEIKHLPHGSIRDYWQQCCLANPHHKISRKLFSSVLRTDSEVHGFERCYKLSHEQMPEQPWTFRLCPKCV